MPEEIQELMAAYRGAPDAATRLERAEALVEAVLACGEGVSRAALDAAFWAASAVKKASKPQADAHGAQTGDAARVLLFARKIVALRERLRRLPAGEGRLTEKQTNAYAWAVYAVAKESGEADEQRAFARRFCDIYQFRVAHGWRPEAPDARAWERASALAAANRADAEAARACARAGDVAGSVARYHAALEKGPLAPFFARDSVWQMVRRVWKSEVLGRELRLLMVDFLRLAKRPDESQCVSMRPKSPLLIGFRSLQGPAKKRDASEEDELTWKAQRGFLVGLAWRLHDLEKGEGANRATIPYDMAELYLRIAEENCVLLREEDFARRAISEETRAHLRGAARKLKAWPSNVERIIGVAARCVKAHAQTPVPLRPGERLFAFLGRHLAAGAWFGYYYALWLQAAGRSEEAARHLVKTVEAKKDEAWAWDLLGDLHAEGKPEQACACYCRALTCPVRKAEIAEPMARKTHRKLAAVLRALDDADVEVKEELIEQGDLEGPITSFPRPFRDAAAQEETLAQAEHPLPGQVAFYEEHVDEADVLLLEGKRTRTFSGRLDRPEGRAFGFVRDNCDRRFDVFVPPPLAKRCAHGARVKGTAVLAMDRKKGREGWEAAVLRPVA